MFSYSLFVVCCVLVFVVNVRCCVLCVVCCLMCVCLVLVYGLMLLVGIGLSCVGC